MKRADIRALADYVRAKFQITSLMFPIVGVMEVYHEVDKGFVYDICEEEEMGVNHGLTYPDKKLMKIRNDVYERACAGHGRDRMTIAHELGHLIMHRNVALAKRVSTADIPAYRNSEWQANCFGGELLVPASEIRNCESALEASAVFGVTFEAASYQWAQYKKEGIIK